MKEICIKNGNLHNLKNIDLKIPKDKFIVFTGVSGSGKSTLAFDILFKEGCRGYLESIGYGNLLSQRSGFDAIEGLGATVAVKQRVIRASNPRSVVGTKTGIYDYIKMLYFTEGTVKCKACGGLANKKLICNKCGREVKRVSIYKFSFNSPNGMCLKCMGRGYVSEIDLEKFLSYDKVSLKEMCMSLPVTPQIKKELKRFVKLYDIKEEDDFDSLDEEVKKAFLYGVKDKFWGVVPNLKWKMLKGRDIGQYGKMRKCPNCDGKRLGDDGRRVYINNRDITEIGNMSIKELKDFLINCRESDDFHPQGRSNLEYIIKKLDNLINADLGHLTLYRPIPTLSGGELQRLFLMEQLNLSMDSLIYIFDEPTAGLHELEKEKLLNRIMDLKNHGNTVIVVEHDRNTIKMGEHIIDFGPMAGVNGGNIVFQGCYEELLKCKESVTGRYLSGVEKVDKKKVIIEDIASRKKLKVFNANTNNLKGINVEIPLGLMVAFAGVSGSGKTSLVAKTLIPLLKDKLKACIEDEEDDEGEDGSVSENDSEIDVLHTEETQLEGAEFIDGFVEIGQNPIGRNSRSNILTYLNIWEEVRKLFAQEGYNKSPDGNLEETFYRYLSPGDFSFNSKGACELCKGSGVIENSIGDLGVLSMTCPECNGQRYREQIVKIKYREKSIIDVLNMSVTEGKEFFEENSTINEMLSIVEYTGMGYITLGQPTPTLSGGEAQRIKLAKEIGKKHKNNILYILDEPTTGLSFYDTAKLIPLLQDLVNKGNSVIIIEHDPEVLANCDWIIELGPGSADEGGLIIAEGTPSGLRGNSHSIIGKLL